MTKYKNFNNKAKIRYRFFRFTDAEGNEDFCRATDVILAQAVFERYYPGVAGTVREIFMADWDPAKLKKQGVDNS